MKGKIFGLAAIMLMGAALFQFAVNAKPNGGEKIVLAQTATTGQSEWQAYKKEQEEKIRINDERIAALRANADTTKTLAAVDNTRIENLQKRNAELRTKITTYKYNESKWDQFKREFNHDMAELGKAIKDLGKDNVK